MSQRLERCVGICSEVEKKRTRGRRGVERRKERTKVNILKIESDKERQRKRDRKRQRETKRKRDRKRALSTIGENEEHSADFTSFVLIQKSICPMLQIDSFSKGWAKNA